MSDDLILSALTRIEAAQAALQAEQATMRTEQAAMHAEQVAMRTDQAALRAEQATLRADFLAELGKTRSAIIEKISGVLGAVEGIRDDITVNMGGVDAALKANDNTRTDVKQMREQMTIMWRQIKTLEAQMRDITGQP